MRERRRIILCEDGRHDDPTEEEISALAEGLRRDGVGGWLAVSDGLYYSQDKLSVMTVRELAPARTTWDAAVEAFQALRRHGTAPY